MQIVPFIKKLLDSKGMKIFLIGAFLVTVPIVTCLVMLIATVARESQGQSYDLLKPSLDDKYIAKLKASSLTGKMQRLKLYVQKKGNSTQWLVAQQDVPTKQYIADDIDVVWRPENRLYIFSDSKFTLNSEEINCAGDKIRVHQLRSKSPCPK